MREQPVVEVRHEMGSVDIADCGAWAISRPVDSDSVNIHVQADT